MKRTLIPTLTLAILLTGCANTQITDLTTATTSAANDTTTTETVVSSSSDTSNEESSTTEETTTAEETTEECTTTAEPQPEKEVLLKVEHFTPDGKFIYSQTREYVKNDKGEPLPSKFKITGNPSDSIMAIKEYAARYEYDDDFKHEKYYNEKDELSSEYFYDDNGYIIKHISYSQGKVNNVTLYENNSDGLPVKETRYDGSEKDYSRVHTTTNTYSKDRLKKSITVTKNKNGNGDAKAEIVYKYDDNGNNTKISASYSYGGGQKDVFTYDDHNNCTSKKTTTTGIDGNSTPQNEFKYEYSYNGNTYTKTILTKSLVKKLGFFPDSQETYSGDKIIEKIVYSPQEAVKGNLESVAEIVEYTYGKA